MLKTNFITLVMDTAVFRLDFEKMNPQCMNCSIVNSIAFCRSYFHGSMLRNECKNCDKRNQLKTDGILSINCGVQ